MKIENTQVFGFEASIRAMRNPMDSWNKSDSDTFPICSREDFDETNAYDESLFNNNKNQNIERFLLGEADKDLSQKLTKGGGEHRKHLRLISVWCDITLPRFVWQEMDTYKHKENVSCSTMHKLMSYPISEEMFELGEDFIPDSIINTLNDIIAKYKNTTVNEDKKHYKYWAKTILPESFLQKRTMWTNYETLLNLHNQRAKHELPQWQTINEWILQLPYFVELTGVSK